MGKARGEAFAIEVSTRIYREYLGRKGEHTGTEEVENTPDSRLPTPDSLASEGGAVGYVLLIYDIPDDRIRYKVSERCKDYGLSRIQYSAFAGNLDRNRREELLLRLRKTLGKKAGNIRLQPVCTRDLALAKEVAVEPT